MEAEPSGADRPELCAERRPGLVERDVAGVAMAVRHRS